MAESFASNQTIRPSGPARIQVVGGSLDLDLLEAWNRTEGDREILVSLHRWGWLLRAFEEDLPPTFEWGVFLIRSWIKEMGPLPAGLASEPYTVAERVTNTIQFVHRCCGSNAGSEAIPPDIRSALTVMTHYVANNLEYQRGLSIGNHPVNNARALLFAGETFGVEEWSALGIAILNERLPALITADGFLNQGSSHYHLLVTRWLSDIRDLCSYSKREDWDSVVGPAHMRLSERASFFLFESESGKLDFPLIGDVSPDLPPHALLRLPWHEDAKRFMHEARRGDGSPSVQSFPKSGWHRLDFGELTFFWFTEPPGGGEFASHSHLDTCSFVILVSGKPFIIDPGRTSYEPSSLLGCYGFGAESHSTLLLDGCAPLLKSQLTWFPAWYRSADVHTEWREHSGGFEFEIRHTGFRRLALGPITHSRMFRISEGEIEIVDALNGKGLREFSLRFQFDSRVKLDICPEGRSVACYTSDIDAILEVTSQGLLSPRIFWDKRDNPVAGVRSMAYGECEGAASLHFCGTVPLPSTITSRILFRRANNGAIT